MITAVSAIRTYMGTEKPVTLQELVELRKADPKGYNWMAEESAKALGETIAPAK